MKKQENDGKNLSDYNLNWEPQQKLQKIENIGKTAKWRCLFESKTCLIQSKSEKYSVMLIARPSIPLNFNFWRFVCWSWHDISNSFMQTTLQIPNIFTLSFVLNSYFCTKSCLNFVWNAIAIVISFTEPIKCWISDHKNEKR